MLHNHYHHNTKNLKIICLLKYLFVCWFGLVKLSKKCWINVKRSNGWLEYHRIVVEGHGFEIDEVDPEDATFIEAKGAERHEAALVILKCQKRCECGCTRGNADGKTTLLNEPLFLACGYGRWRGCTTPGPAAPALNNSSTASSSFAPTAYITVKSRIRITPNCSTLLRL